MVKRVATAFGLAQLYWFQSDYSRTEPLYQQVVEGRRRLFGEDDRETLLAINSLTHLYSFRDETERAVRSKNPPGFRNARLSDALTRLVQFYEVTGQADEAARWQTTLENTRVAPDRKPGP